MSIIVKTSSALSRTDTSPSVIRHLSSRTLYRDNRPIPGGKPLNEPLPSGHEPLYLHYIGRHGTRWPTEKRMKQYTTLAKLFQAAGPDAPEWTKGWQMPFSDVWDRAGMLHPIGEDEMRSIAGRFKTRFPKIFDAYNPSHHTFISTQVPRTSASASAFAQGLFPCDLRPHDLPRETCLSDQQCCLPQPVSLFMRPKHDDPILRFFNLSPEFQLYLEHLRPKLRAFETSMLKPLVPKIEQKLNLPQASLQTADVSSLWQLCQQEASLLSKYGCSCSLFDHQDMELMEYCEDVMQFARKGHLCTQAYTMSKELLKDINASLQLIPGQIRARVHLAHAETMSPMAASLGLFGAPSMKQILKSESCPADLVHALPRSESSRMWWASTVIPFGANLALLVHGPKEQKADLYVRAYWNEQAIPLPASRSTIDCPLPDFLAFLEEQLQAMAGLE